MKKNLNPLYEFIMTPEKMEAIAMATEADTAPAMGTFMGTAGGTAIGTIGGTGYGMYKGFKASNDSVGSRERNIIKDIIITSNTAEECIDKLRKRGTKRALRYASKVEENKNGDWKRKLISNINNKNIALNIAGTVGGGFGGAALGGALGSVVGGFTGYGLGKIEQKRIIDYLNKRN